MLQHKGAEHARCGAQLRQASLGAPRRRRATNPHGRQQRWPRRCLAAALERTSKGLTLVFIADMPAGLTAAALALAIRGIAAKRLGRVLLQRSEAACVTLVATAAGGRGRAHRGGREGGAAALLLLQPGASQRHPALSGGRADRAAT